jgi:hypothetical protein
MYLHLMRKNKVVQVLVIENEDFLKENEEFLMKEFEADSFLIEKEQACDLEDNFIEEKKSFNKSKNRYAEELKEKIDHEIILDQEKAKESEEKKWQY